MKIMPQFGIIFGISLLGEGLHALVPLPIPASVYGLVLMLIALLSGIIKLNQVEKAADLFVEFMPVMFVPAGVGLMTVWGDIRAMVFPLLVLIVSTTVLVMVVTGKVAQGVMRAGQKEETGK